jgi:hypothetical protein
VELTGGVAHRGLVVRIGDTVRRPRSNPAVPALLDHLAAVGFDGAPRFLGVDEQGREVLSYLPGTCVVPPYPAWALTDEALVSVARLLRDFHRAVASFDPRPHTWTTRLPEEFTGELVSHNDPNLDNVVFRDGRAVALIDFDLAGPGSRVWDVAAAARMWAPLRPDEHIRDERRGRALPRFRLFLDAYGMPTEERAGVVSAVRANQQWFCRLVEAQVAAGHEAFTEYWTSGASVRAEASRSWLARHEPDVRAAVGA